MGDERGDQNVDSASTANDPRQPDESTEEEYPLTFRSLFFWGIVVFLGLLGACVVIAIFLALTKGS